MSSYIEPRSGNIDLFWKRHSTASWYASLFSLPRLRHSLRIAGVRHDDFGLSLGTSPLWPVASPLMSSLVSTPTNTNKGILTNRIRFFDCDFGRHNRGGRGRGAGAGGGRGGRARAGAAGAAS